MDPVFRCVPTDIVGRSVNLATFDAASGHQHAEGIRMVVAARPDFSLPATVLSQWSPSKLRPPHDHCRIQQATLFQIFD